MADQYGACAARDQTPVRRNPSQIHQRQAAPPPSQKRRDFLRGSLFWLANAFALGSFIAGLRFYQRSAWALERANTYLTRAVFNSQCSSPGESEGCASLYANEPYWAGGVEITDSDVLLTYTSLWMELGSGDISIASLFMGMAGVALAASVIVRGQAKVRQEAREPQ